MQLGTQSLRRDRSPTRKIAPVFVRLVHIGSRVVSAIIASQDRFV